MADDAHDLEEEMATRALTRREWSVLLAAARGTRPGDAGALAPLRNDEVRITCSQLLELAAAALATDAIDVAAALPSLPAAMLRTLEGALGAARARGSYATAKCLELR